MSITNRTIELDKKTPVTKAPTAFHFAVCAVYIQIIIMSTGPFKTSNPVTTNRPVSRRFCGRTSPQSWPQTFDLIRRGRFLSPRKIHPPAKADWIFAFLHEYLVPLFSVRVN